MPNRVFITGFGAKTACGLSAAETWGKILSGNSGIGPIKGWDLSSWVYKLGGEVPIADLIKTLPDRKISKVISPQDILGISAALEAIAHSDIINFRDSLDFTEGFNDATAIFVGSPGNKYFQQYDFLPLLNKTDGDMNLFAESLFSEVHPMWLLRILPNNVLAYTGISYGFKGPNHNFTNHAVGSMQALLEAYRALQNKEAERAIVIGYDVGLEPQALFYYEQLGLLSAKDLKPFDIAQDGTILADGAAAIVLETETSVLERNAKTYAEILGGGTSTEAAGLFGLNPEGTHLTNLIKVTLDESEIPNHKIDLVVAHGNGNFNSDYSEALALQQIFKNYIPPVTAFKWGIGHTLAASGLLDLVLTTLTLNNAIIPGISNFTKANPAYDFLPLSNTARSLPQCGRAMVINRGFGGMNAIVLLKATSGE